MIESTITGKWVVDTATSVMRNLRKEVYYWVGAFDTSTNTRLFVADIRRSGQLGLLENSNGLKAILIRETTNDRTSAPLWRAIYDNSNSDILEGAELWSKIANTLRVCIDYAKIREPERVPNEILNSRYLSPVWDQIPPTERDQEYLIDALLFIIGEK